MGFQWHKNDKKSFFSFLNLTVPWGLLAKNATTNPASAGHGAISGRKIDSTPGLQSVPGHLRPQNAVL